MTDSSETILKEGMMIALGNPLLDMSVIADDDLLKKYKLKPNDAILAEAEHIPLYKELVEKYNVEYIAGGSALNSMRVAQWIMKKPKVAVMLGCVGQDDYSKILEKCATDNGVDARFQYTDAQPTGTCAVLITRNGSARSLCANLAAANCFTTDHIKSLEIRKLIENAEFYYSSGFFLTVNIDAIMEVVHVAHKRNKTFMMNLSAPFLVQFFKDNMMKAMPYVDILCGNETEVLTFSKEHNFDTENLVEIAVKLASLPKQNPARERLVIVTQGADPIIVAEGGKTTTYNVPHIPPEKVVDTNGAGDSFVGGFVSQMVKGEKMDKCIKCGIWAATEIIQRSGTTFTGEACFNG